MLCFAFVFCIRRYTSNWASGFRNGQSGVAYHGEYVTNSSTDLLNCEWLISTDQKSLYRANGIDYTLSTIGVPAVEYDRLAINAGATKENSDFAIFEIQIYKFVPYVFCHFLICRPLIPIRTVFYRGTCSYKIWHTDYFS